MNKVTGVTEQKARSRGRSGSSDTHAHTSTKGILAMSKKLLTRAAVGAAMVVAVIAGTVLPASATTYNYNIEAQRMRITVGSTNFDTPGSTPATCIGSTGITGQIDDSAGTITGNLNILSSDFSAPFAPGRYQLEATGTANSGTYNAGNRTFNNLAFPQINFTIRSINTSTCTPGATVCSGTAQLTASGELDTGVTLPLSTGDKVLVNGTGKILTTSSCGFPWGLVVYPNASLTVGPNPSPPGDTHAIFGQL